MNFALPAIVFLFFIVPGLVFSARLYRVDGAVLDFQPISEKMAHVFFWSWFVHLALAAIIHILGASIRYDVIVAALAGKFDASHLTVVENSFFNIGIYLISSVVISNSLAWLVRYFVEKCSLDVKFGWLKFDSPWFYIFTDDRSVNHEGTHISALVDLKDGTYLYTGILEEYFFNQGGGLDRIILGEVSRRKLSSDKTDVEVDRFYRVDGDYLVLRYDEIITMNVRYVKVDS